MDNRWLTLGIVVAFALAGLAPTALADHGETLQKSKTVTVSVPFVIASGRTSCDAPSQADGVDVHWFQVEKFQNHTFRVQVDATLDVDPFFYNADDKDQAGQCYEMGSGHPWVAGYGGLGTWEYGKIPSNATHLAVDHFSGAGQFTVESPNPACSAAPNCPPPSAD